ncbi:MAG: hypothetical protein JSU63_02825 [Phycisphaerales bacterium]|nr:MAG: hypothetical protein JSU63_02825 [Phycisphaerales bacterium]
MLIQSGPYEASGRTIIDVDAGRVISSQETVVKKVRAKREDESGDVVWWNIATSSAEHTLVVLSEGERKTAKEKRRAGADKRTGRESPQGHEQAFVVGCGGQRSGLGGGQRCRGIESCAPLDLPWGLNAEIKCALSTSQLPEPRQPAPIDIGTAEGEDEMRISSRHSPDDIRPIRLRCGAGRSRSFQPS